MIKTTQHTARTLKQCSVCRRVILPGMQYYNYRDTITRTNTEVHIHCDALWTAFCMRNPEALDDGRDADELVEEWAVEKVCTECMSDHDTKLCDLYRCPNVLSRLVPSQWLDEAMKSAGWNG